MQSVMRGAERAQVETVVTADPPFMPQDVMWPVQVPGKRMRGENNGRSGLGVRESARGEVLSAIRDADLRRGAFGHRALTSYFASHFLSEAITLTSSQHKRR